MPGYGQVVAAPFPAPVAPLVVADPAVAAVCRQRLRRTSVIALLLRAVKHGQVQDLLLLSRWGHDDLPPPAERVEDLSQVA